MKELTTHLGIIGGSGLYSIDGIDSVTESDIMTPFGRPSDSVVTGILAGRKISFLPRHGKGHRLLPSEVNSKANIWALKSLGVTHIVSVSAVGSLVESYKPGDIVVPDSIIDRTTGHRPHTFFGNGLVGHVSLADPYCDELRKWLIASANQSLRDVSTHIDGVYLCIEGPRFSTRAESHLYRQFGATVIGMTAMPEAALAREAEIAYATLAFITDYDCWHEVEEDVSVAAVLAILKKNVEASKKVIGHLAETIPLVSANSIFESARFALMTDPELVPLETKRSLEPLYGKYWKE